MSDRSWRTGLEAIAFLFRFPESLRELVDPRDIFRPRLLTACSLPRLRLETTFVITARRRPFGRLGFRLPRGLGLIARKLRFVFRQRQLRIIGGR